jgi:hypothetical protein
MGYLDVLSSKKVKYWPKHVPCNAMKAFFDVDRVNVGKDNTVAGTLDRIQYNIWVVKEPNYVIKMMLCGRQLNKFDSCKGGWKGGRGGLLVSLLITRAHLIGIFGIGTLLMILTIYIMLYHQMKIVNHDAVGSSCVLFHFGSL